MLNVSALGVDHLGLTDNGVHQAELLGLVGGETATCQHKLFGGGVADFAHYERRDGGWCEAQSHFCEGKFGFLFCNHDVGSGDDAVGSTDAGAMYADDDCLVAKIYSLEQLGEFFGIRDILIVTEASHVLHIGQVGTSTEGLAVAFQDDDADVVTTVEPVEDLGQLSDQLGIQGVTYLGAVEVDPSHTFAQLYLYRIEIHFFQFSVYSCQFAVMQCIDNENAIIGKICQIVAIIPQKKRFFADGMVFDELFYGPYGLQNKRIMDENNLNNDLDNLLNMFKKLMEKQDLDAIPGLNEEQKEQLKMFLSDFDELKDDMKVEIYKLDPFTKQMVGMFMGQLKNFTGEASQVATSPTAPHETRTNKEKQLTDIPGTTENLEAQLATIDKQLRNPDLSDEDINRLLDERTSIVRELKVEG